jgi:hypothetical protein
MSFSGRVLGRIECDGWASGLGVSVRRRIGKLAYLLETRRCWSVRSYVGGMVAGSDMFTDRVGEARTHCIVVCCSVLHLHNILPKILLSISTPLDSPLCTTLCPKCSC